MFVPLINKLNKEYKAQIDTLICETTHDTGNRICCALLVCV